MKNISRLIFAVLFLTFAVAIKAQEETPNAAPQNFNQQRRPNLLAELDLTRNQIQQIQLINVENKDSRRAAQEKLRAATRLLDQAIYADNTNETEIQTRIKDVLVAQTEVIKLKSATEFAVRKVLTPEQLVKFREIRQRFMERNETLKPQNNRPLNAPNQRLLNRRRLRNN